VTLDQVVRTTGVFANSSDLNTTVSNIVDDCHDHVHFTRKLMIDYWHTLDGRMREMMNELNKHIYDQFNTSLAQIDIPDEIALLTYFVNQTNITAIANKVARINADLNKLEITLVNISSTGAMLPMDLTNSTIDEVRLLISRDTLSRLILLVQQLCTTSNGIDFGQLSVALRHDL
jgi:hypothetical protein